MANYKINEKSKTISVSGTLSEIERSIISTYILNGYKVKEKRSNSSSRITNSDIEEFYKDNKEVLREYEEVKEKKYKDKNGVERKGGFLKGLKWMRENHKEDYDKLLKKISK